MSTVVVGVDGSRTALRAVRWAASEARARDVPLRLAHAEMPLPQGIPGLDDRTRQEMHKQALLWLDEAAGQAGGVAVQYRAQIALAAPLLTAESERADLVVLGSRGTGTLASLLLGSTAVAVGARSSCPVVVVPDHDPKPGPVVCGIRSVDDTAALARAFEQARGNRLVVVSTTRPHLLSAPDDQATADHSAHLARTVDPWRRRHPDVQVDLVVRGDHPAHTLREWARGASLLVVGSRGRGTLAGWLHASTSQALLHRTPCPVMLVPLKAPTVPTLAR
ncbi:universal stress protein [Actinosynnema mirum]|uniref:UspA domain protein n=1 Tax=Actinosynnema mirum (strain ATCC 29888 / DSM 43827 / JCM 3225 / NBRC 14064 / NCIMB 13271 / NRRL B-12336 / IMRU 3971 / 101) TaxID=446462 RepID=C6WJY1_ACTMD|nr:universal stress protein [Actinosynnema mirum]ACU36356.1 UspA domain protein [Actinosynnema mirum DSM 43827]